MPDQFNPNDVMYDPMTSPDYQEGPIALSAPQVQPQELIALSGPNLGNPIPSSDYSKRLAEKVALGFGKSLDISPEGLNSLVAAGQEDLLRIQLAGKLDNDRRNAILDNAKQLAIAKGSPLTPEEYAAVVDPWNKKTDPSRVIEDAYNERWLSSPQDAYNLSKYRDYKKAVQDAADFDKSMQNVMGKYMTIQQDLEKWAMKAKAASEQQSYFGDVIDRAKDLSQIYAEWTQRGGLFPEDGSFKDGVLLGTNIQEQGTRLFRLEPEDARQRLEKTLPSMIAGNPFAALQFIQHLKGMTPGEVLGQNTMTALLGAGLASTPFKVPAYVRSVAQWKYITNLRTQIARDFAAASNPNPHPGEINSQPTLSTSAAMSEAVGDVESAALRQNEAWQTQAATRTSDKIAQDQAALLKYQQGNTEALVQGDLGQASRELRTRIADAIDAFSKGFVSRWTNALKVDPLGMPLATAENRELLLNDIRSRFKGLGVTLNNIEIVDFNTNPRAGPNYYHPITNRPHVRYTIHNYDGTLFSDEATARGFAETQWGLANPELKNIFGPITSREMDRKIARRNFVEAQINRTNDDINVQKQAFASPETSPSPNTKKRFYTAGDGQLYSTLEEAKAKVSNPSEIRYVDLFPSDIKKLSGVIKEDAKPSGFKTAKGSSYVIQENGTTIRNKKARPEHPGDYGVKPASAKTVYISKEVADGIAPPTNAKVAFVIHDDGKISLAVNLANNWGISKSAKELIYSNTPQKGLIPLELWNKSTLKGLDSYSRWHFGNKITEVSFDIKNPANFNPISYTKKDYEKFKVLKGTEGTTHQTARDVISKLQDNLKKLHAERDRLSAEIKQAGEATYNVQQHGMGFQIVHERPLDTTNDLVRTLMTRERDTVLPSGEVIKGQPFKEASVNTEGLTGLTRGIFGRWMTPNNVMSKEEVRQRITAEAATNYMFDYLKEGEKYIQAVVRGRKTFDPITGEKISAWKWIPRSVIGKISNRTVAKQFEEVLDYARTAIDPANPAAKEGYWFKTMGEMDAFYLSKFGRPASESEHFAYHMHKTLHEMQRVTMEIAERQNKEGMGAEKFKIFMNGPNKERLGSEFFDGIEHKGLPSGGGQILIIGPHKGAESVLTIGSPEWTALRKKLKENIDSGKGKVIQLWSRDSMPLGNFSDVANGKPIQWVYTENGFHRKPLEWDAVKYVEGGHWEYDYNHYIKQAVMRQEGPIQDEHNPADRTKIRWSYVADQTLMPIKNRAQGRQITGFLNEARIALKNGDEVRAQIALAKTGIPYERFKGWFSESVGPDGARRPASFSLNDDFVVVPKDRKIMDIDTSLEEKYKRLGKKVGEPDNEFYDSFNRGSPDLQFKNKWNQERDSSVAWTIENTNWFGKPVYEYRPAEMASPLQTMSRALNRSVSSLWMNDYKTYAVNHWISEVGPILDVHPNELRFSPYYYYNIAHEKLFKSAVPETTRNHYLDIKDKQRIFMGTPSNYDTYGQIVAQWAADTLYEKGALKPALWPEYMYGHITKPIDFIRSFAFNMKLGLFSPVNFLVQGQTFVNIAALEPRLAPKGTAGLYLYWMARENAAPHMIKALDDKAVAMGFRPGDFTEALDVLRQSGWEYVGTSHASAKGTLERDFFKSDIKGVLDAGQAAFRLSEKAPRVAAFFTSYLKWREANPAAKMTEAIKREILGYADDLTFNMTRASSSRLHTGIFSLTNQFLAYQFRMIELMTSERLGATTMERARKRAQLLGTYWGMYGFPSVLNTAFLGIPIGSYYKEWMISNGYQPGSPDGGNNDLWTLFNEGLVNTAIGFISGLGDMNKGKWLNWGDRYGPQGMAQVQEFLRTDSNFLKLMGGAGLNTLYETYKGADGLFSSIADMIFKKPGEAGKHPIKFEDFIDPLRPATTINQAMKAFTAFQTGYWSNKKEGLTEKTSVPWAITQALTGLEPASQAQMFIMSGISKDWQRKAQEALSNATIEWQRAIRAGAAGDKAGMEEYLSRTNYWLSDLTLNERQQAQFFSRASKGYETLLEKMRENFYLNKNVPPDKEKKLFDVYRGIQRKEYNQ